MAKINFKIVSLLAISSASIYAEQQMDAVQHCSTYLSTQTNLVRLTIPQEEFDKSNLTSAPTSKLSSDESLSQKEFDKSNLTSAAVNRLSSDKPVTVAESDFATLLQSTLKGTGHFVWQSLAQFEPDALKYHFPILDSKLGDILIAAARTPMGDVSYEEWFSKVGSKVAASYGLNVEESFSLQTALSLMAGNKAYQAAFIATARLYSPVGTYVFEDELKSLLELTPGYVSWLLDETNVDDLKSATNNVSSSKSESSLFEDQNKNAQTNPSFFSKVGNVWDKFTFSVKKGVQQIRSAMTLENAKNYTAQKAKRVLTFFGIPGFSK